MTAEKAIVNFWMHQRGFLTLNNIPAGNREIDILAIGSKYSNQMIQHISVSCSVSSVIIDAGNINENVSAYINSNFEAKLITDTISNYIKDYYGVHKDYEKVAVLSGIQKNNRKEIVNSFRRGNIILYEFEDILNDVMINLDTHYYRSDTIRSLQLIKYLLLSDPDKLSRLLENEGILKSHSKGEFLRNLLKEDRAKKSFGRLSTEPEIAGLLKYSALTNPAVLAKTVAEELLGERSRKKFLNALLKEKKMNEILKEVIAEEEPKLNTKKLSNHKLQEFYERITN